MRDSGSSLGQLPQSDRSTPCAGQNREVPVAVDSLSKRSDALQEFPGPGSADDFRGLEGRRGAVLVRDRKWSSMHWTMDGAGGLFD